MALKEEFLQLLRTDPELRDAARREILTEDLLAAPERLDRLTRHIDAMDSRLVALTERLERIAQLQETTQQELRALSGQVQGLVGQVGGLAGQMQTLNEWRRGDQGRRDGERYERDTVRHAYMLFGGGRDAAGRPEDLERLQRALDPQAAEGDGLPDTDDPFLADLLWLKGERIAVVEVSAQVDRWDVERAVRRAAALRRGGLAAVPVVIGQGWASSEAAAEAAGQSVAWRVGGESSEGYLAFRRERAA
jgi:hypothetical protein